MTTLRKGLSAHDFTHRPKQRVETSAITVSDRQSGATFSNQGANGSVTFTLPTAAPGLKYTFINGTNASDALVVTPAGSDVIRVGVDVAASTITSESSGDSITLECVEAGTWWTTAVVGLWV